MEGEVIEEVFGELARVGGEEAFEFVDVVEGFTGGELAGGIDGLADEVGVGMAGGIDAGDFFAALHAAIAISPSAHDIEVLHGEADGIKLRVTGGAGFGFGVFREQGADGGGSADVRLHGRNAFRRRWRRLAEQFFHDPNASQHG